MLIRKNLNTVDITPLGFDVHEVNPPGRCQRMFHPTRLALYLHWMAVTSIYDPDLEHLSFSERPQAMITEMMSMLANGGNLLMPLDDMEAQLAESLGVPNEWDDLKHVMAEKLASDPDCMPVLEGWAPLRTRVVIPRHGCDVVYTTTDEGDGTRVHIYVPDVLRKRRRIADPIVAVCNQDPSCRSDVAEADEVGIEQEQEHNASLDDDDIKQEHDAFLDDNGIKQEHEASVDDIDSAMRDMNIGSNTESPGKQDLKSCQASSCDFCHPY